MNSIKENILITGASGFLGSSVLKSFNSKNYNVFTLGRKKITNSTKHIFWDCSNDIPKIEDIEFSKVIHIAGKAHIVPKTEEEELEFFKINLDGTKNLILAIQGLSLKPKHFIFISTVAVYGLEEGLNISESHETLPKTPYGISKLDAENEIISWATKNHSSFVILRLPLIAGVNPPGNLGAMKKAIARNRYPRVLNNLAKKSVVLDDDVAKLIESISCQSGIYNLTDKHHPSFAEIENALEKRTGKKISLTIPKFVLRIAANFGDILNQVGINFPFTSNKLNKIITSLTFDDRKAQSELNWKPNPVIPFIEKYI